MSGPALKQVHSHSSIHEAALGEAEQLAGLLRTCLEGGKQEQAYTVACVALEHWESRTLAHAQEEEEGLYREIVNADPMWSSTIAALVRDHTLMRKLAGEIRELLAAGSVDREVLSRFEAMRWIDLLHNHEEESMVAAIGGRG